MTRPAESLHLIEAEDLAEVRQWAPPALARTSGRAPPTAAHLESLEQAAWDEGFRRGQAEGRKAGETQAEVAAAPALAALQDLLDRLQTPFAREQAQLGETLCQLARSLAERLMVAELRADPERLGAILDQSLDALGEQRRALRLRCAPDMVETLRRLSAGRALDARVLTDASLGAGDLMIDGDPISVDARVQTRLDRLFADWPLPP